MYSSGVVPTAAAAAVIISGETPIKDAMSPMSLAMVLVEVDLVKSPPPEGGGVVEPEPPEGGGLAPPWFVPAVFSAA